MTVKLRRLIVNLLAILVIGCGGGTRGSGGQLYDGFIGDESLKALPGISVTIIQSGDSAISDQDGRFTIKTINLSGKLSLLVEGRGISSTIQTAEVSEDAVRIKLSITIPSTGSSGASATIEVAERRPSKVPATKTPTGSDDDSGRPDGNGGSDDESDDNDDSEDDGKDDSDDGQGGSNDGSDDDSDEHGSGGSGGGDGTSGGSGGDSDGDSPRNGDKRDVSGVIGAISDSSITVSNLEFLVTKDSEFRDTDGKKAALSDFRVGLSVRARGVYLAGKLILERLEVR